MATKRKRSTSGSTGSAKKAKEAETWELKDMTPEVPPTPITKDDSKYFKIISWNVNGMAALLKKKEALPEYVAKEDPDVICFQETKYAPSKKPGKGFLGSKYPFEYWNCCTVKNGYSGTGLISKTEPLSIQYGIGVEEHDGEGRVITAEYEHFYLICTYIPNAGQKLERLTYRCDEWNPALLNFMKNLEKKKPVIWTGDLNVAHQEIDIYKPKGNQKSAGFTPQERKGFTELLEQGFVDTYRHQNPTKQEFSYFGYRFNMKAQNKGWRLDYFVVSQSLLPMAGKTFIRPGTAGSDHVPIGILMARQPGQDMTETFAEKQD